MPATAVTRTSILHDVALRALLLAETVSTTGSQMTGLALPWFVLTTTGSPKQMSYVVAAEIGAYVLVGIPSGAVIGRLGSRRAMLVCDGLRAPLMLLVPLLHWSGRLRFGELLAVAFVLGLLSAPYGGAQRVITADLLSDDPARVAQANALFQGATRITLVAGPPLAGVLIGVIGAPAVLVVDAGSFVAAFLLVALFVPRSPGRSRGDAAGVRVLDGLRYLRRDRMLAALGAVITVGDGAFQVIFIGLPVLVVAHYGGHARLVGLFFGAWGAGAVLGNIASYRAFEDGAPPRAIATLVVFVQALPLFTLATPVPWEALTLALAVSGLGNGLVNPTIHSQITLRPPHDIRPHVITTLFTLSAIGAPAALLVAGPAFKAFGPRTVLAVAVACQAAAMIGYAAALLRLSSTPSARTTEPASPSSSESPAPPLR